MTRLEGKKPNAGAIIIGAIIFALIAAGLFFAFRSVPEPTDAGLSNAADSTNKAGGASSDANSASNATGDESSNSLTTILTPLPMATPATPISPTAPTDNATNSTANSVVAPKPDGVATDAATPPATLKKAATPSAPAAP